MVVCMDSHCIDILADEHHDDTLVGTPLSLVTGCSHQRLD